MRTLGSVAFLAVLVLSGAALAEVSVQEQVEQGPVGVGDSFQVAVSVSGAERSVSVDLPPGEYQVLGKSRASSVQMSSGPNGMETRRTEQFFFTLSADHAGPLTIPAARVTADGAALAGEPVQLEIQRGHVARARPADDDADPLLSMMQQMQQLRGRTFSSPLLRRFFGGDPFAGDPFGSDPFAAAPVEVKPGDVRLEVVADRKLAHPGEQITLSYYLTTRVPLSSVNGLQMPAVRGAATRNVELGKRLTPEVKDGVARVLIAQKALFAAAAGKLQIERATAKVEVGDRLSGRELSVSSEPLTIAIQPLPPGPANAVVGHWSLSLTGPSRAHAGEPMTIRATVRGQGDLASLPAPVLALPSGWKVFPPSTAENETVSDGRFGGTRTWDFVAVPSGEGAASIAPIVLNELDPQSGRYREVRSEPLSLQIEAAPAAPIGDRAQATPASLPAAASPRLLLPLVVGSLLLLGLLVALALWRRKDGEASAADPRAARLRAARRDLTEAHALCDSGHAAAFFERLAGALNQLVAALGHQAAATEEVSGIAAALRRAGLAAPACEAVARAVEACRRFAFLRRSDGATLRRTLALADEAFSAVS